MAPSNSKEVSFSPREMEVLALAWQCMETQPKVHTSIPPCNSLTQPQIDMVKLGSLAGYTTASASVTFGKIKSKLKLLGQSLQDMPSMPGTPSKSTPKKKAATPTSTPRKRKNTAAAADATPSKKGKMPMREEDDVEDDDELIECDVPGVKKEEEMEDYGFLSGIETYAVRGSGGN